MKKIELTIYDVVSTEKEANFAGASTTRGLELADAVVRFIRHQTRLPEDTAVNWVTDGVDCEVLLASGGGWQKGRVRLSLEFIPDTPDGARPTTLDIHTEEKSPLADLRSELEI